MAEEPWPRETRPLRAGLRVSLILALIIQLLLIPTLGWELWFGAVSAEDMTTDPIAVTVPLANAVLSVLWYIIFALCVVYTCRITFRMMKNLEVLEAPGERMSPTDAVVFYFVPIVNLFMPYQGFKQIWKGTFELSSEPQPSGRAVGWWWLFWIASSFAGALAFQISRRAAMIEAGPANIEVYNILLWLGLANNALGAVACLFMIAAFGAVSQAQDQIIAQRPPAAS